MKHLKKAMVYIAMVIGIVHFTYASGTIVPISERVYLSGKGPGITVEWDFHCSSGRRVNFINFGIIPKKSIWAGSKL